MKSLFGIRQWEGTQSRAWEELTFQLRSREVAGVTETRKTKAPDAGVEWYDVYEDGHHEGFQAKFYRSLEDAPWRDERVCKRGRDTSSSVDEAHIHGAV